MEKQYDWFATRIFQPEMSIDELFDQGITPENTGFKTRDEYKNIESVRDQFRNSEGLFDEDAFNRAYNSSREMFNMYVNKEYNKKLLEEFAYDPYEWYAPATAETVDVKASNTPTNNGMFYSTNIAGIGEDTESPYSVREIAQQQLVYDENGNQLDWTPEERGGLLKGLVRDPLVLATYDEDTPEYDEDGNLIAFHKKGEYKLNEWGAPYYEKLGDRDAYGKEMLHYSDTFTREGTILNKFDFYDSDDKKKSVFGTAMKTAAQIVPMFMPNPIKYTWGAINAAKGLGQSMAALGKGIDAIITGDDDDEFGRNLTKMENWLARFDQSKSDYGKEHMWASAETYGDLIGSTAKQLFEQRVVANIPKQLMFLGNKIERSKMGQNMAIAYMAATSAKESYQAGIEAGLGDRQAGLLLLASTAAMWKLMDSDYGRSTLFKGSWFDDDVVKKPARETADFMVKATDKRATLEEVNKQMSKHGSTRLVTLKDKVDDAGTKLLDKADDAIDDVGKAGAGKGNKTTKPKKSGDSNSNTTETDGKKGAEIKENSVLVASKKFLKKAYEKFSASFKEKIDAFKGVDPEEYLSAMLREGVEEVAEEAISDTLKATTLALESLGVKMNETGEKLDYGFSGKDIFDRYLLSFLGGSIGGGIFRAYTAYEQYLDNKDILPNYQKDLIFLIADGKADDIIKEYERLYKKGLLGSFDVGVNFKMYDDAEIDEDNELSQADANLKILTGNVRFIEKIMDSEGLFDAIQQSRDENIVSARSFIWNPKNDHLTERQKRGAFMMLHNIGAHQLMTHDFIKLAEDFVTAKTWRASVLGELLKKDNLTDEEKADVERYTKMYEKRIAELRQERDEILSGARNAKYASSILLESEGVLQKIINAGNLDKDSWAISMYGRTYDALDELKKIQVDKDIEMYYNKSMNFYGRNFVDTHDAAKRTFLSLYQIMRSEFEKQNENLKDKRFNDFHTDNYFGEEFFQSMKDIQVEQLALRELQLKKDYALQKEQTPETQEEIAKLDEEILKVSERLRKNEQRLEQYRFKDGDRSLGENEENLIPRNMLLANFKDNDGIFKNLINTYSDIVKNGVKNNQVASLLKQIFDIYTEIKNDNGLVKDFGEFKMAQQVLIDFIGELNDNLCLLDETYENALRDLSRNDESNIIEGTSETIFTKFIKDTLLDKKSSDRVAFRKHLNALKALLEKNDYDNAVLEYGKIKAIVKKTIDKINDPVFLSVLGETVSIYSNDSIPKAAEVLEYLKKAFYFPELNPDNNFESPFELFFDTYDIVKKINTTPFTQLLQHFITNSEFETTATKYVEEFFDNYVHSNKWTDFFIANSKDQDVLKALMKNIDLLDIMISTDTKTIEAMNMFFDKDNQLVVFDPIAKRNLLRDLDALKSKIFTVYCNGKYNSKNRHADIEKDAKIQTVRDVQSLIKFWGGIDKEKRHKDFDIEAIWNKVAAEQGVDILTLDPNTLTDKQFKDIYRLIKLFEHNVNDAWEKFVKVPNDENATASAFVNLFKESELFKDILLEKRQNPYEKSTIGAPTAVESFEYLLTLISVDGQSLDLAYRQALSFFEKTGRIPNDEQEKATKYTASYLSNPKLWAAIKRAMRTELEKVKFAKDSEEDKIAKHIKARKIVDNIFVIPGSCGVGKTTMVGKVLYYLWGGDRSGIITAPKSKTAENLANTFGNRPCFEVIGASEDGKDVNGKEKLFKFLFGEEATNKFKLKTNGTILEINRDDYKFLNVSEEHIKELEQYEVIIIDEIGQYNEIELQLIDEIAKKAKIYVIGLGDHCQIGDIVEYTDKDGATGTSNSNYQDVDIWKAPYLVRSMRDTSIAKGKNNRDLGHKIQVIESLIHVADREVSKLIDSKIVNGVDMETKLMYSDFLEHGICGDKICTEETEFEKTINHIFETRRSGETISVVVDDKTETTKTTRWTERFKELGWVEGKDYFIKNIEKNEINGYETAYTIVDVDWSKRTGVNDKKTAWKEVYTISQRSHMATIFLDTTDSLKTIHITSKMDKDAHRIWSNDPSFVEQWFEKRMSWFTDDSSFELFRNEESAFKLNHSMDDEEDDDDDGDDGEDGVGEGIVLPVTVDEVLESSSESKSESESDPMGEYEGTEESAEESEEEIRKKEIKKAKDDLQIEAEKVETKLNTFKLKVSSTDITSELFAEIDKKTKEECDALLNNIEDGLRDFKEFKSLVAKAEPEVAEDVKEKLELFEKYSNFLTERKADIERQIQTLALNASLDEAKTEIANSLQSVEKIKETRTDKNFLEVTKKCIDALEGIERYVNGLKPEVKDKLDLSEVVASKAKYQEELNEQLEKERVTKEKFLAEHPSNLEFDEIRTINEYVDQSTEQKKEVVEKIKQVISLYDDAISKLDEFKDVSFLSKEVSDCKANWNKRKSDLKKLIKELEKTFAEPKTPEPEPESALDHDFEGFRKFSETAQNAWRKVNAKKVKNNLLRNAIAASEAVIENGKQILEEHGDALSPAQRDAIQKVIDSNQASIDAHIKLLTMPKENSIVVHEEVSRTKGFKSEHTIHKDAKLDLEKTKSIMEEVDETLSAEQIARSKFSKLGTEQYLELRKGTEGGKKVTVWGLDLETTGVDKYTAEITQVGLIKYEISRVGEEWKIKIISDTKIDEFVKPSSGSYPPKFFTKSGETIRENEPEDVSAEDEKNPNLNPIYKEWLKTKRENKLTDEKEIIQRVFSMIKPDEFVITYNGSYDVTVLRQRSSSLGVATDNTSSWKVVDVYTDFIGNNSRIKGVDLLWNRNEGVPTFIDYFQDHKLATVSEPIEKKISLKDLKAHNAITDVHATLNVMLNLFEGINFYKDEIKFVRSGYTKVGVEDDIYISSHLLPYIDGLKKTNPGLFKNLTEGEVFTHLVKMRHKLLDLDSDQLLEDGLTGEKQWKHNLDTNISTLYYIHEGHRFNELPLLSVKGQRTGTYTGTFSYTKPKFDHRFIEDVDLLKLRQKYPMLRFSKPFILTGLKYNEFAPDKLSDKAKKFYNPENERRNLGKTFVLVTSDPSFEDDFDPSAFLKAHAKYDKNGNVVEVNWRNVNMKMLTVSSDADFQEMIDFSIASCCLAADKIETIDYMAEFFETRKTAIQNAQTKYNLATTDAAKKEAEDEIARYTNMAGISLSQTQYERLLKDAGTAKEKMKLLSSELFSVMDNRNVGGFVASLINALMKQGNNIDPTTILKNGKEKIDLHGKTLHQWLFDHLIGSVRQHPHYVNWNDLKTLHHNQYFSLDIVVEGIEFKLVADKIGKEVNLYLFKSQGNTTIPDSISAIKSAIKAGEQLSLDKVGIKLTGKNTYSDIITNLEKFFKVGEFGKELKFSKLDLMSTSVSKSRPDIGTYNVNTNEVFTRVFTDWEGDKTVEGYGTPPARIVGWNDLFDILKDDMDGFTHGIYGHEIIDKTPGSMEHTIFTPSINTTSLSGRYKARSTKMVKYGMWSVNDDVEETDAVKKKMDTLASQIRSLGTTDFQVAFDQSFDIISQDPANKNLSTEKIKELLVRKANEIAQKISVGRRIEQFFSLDNGSFVVKKRFKDEIEKSPRYNPKYYFVTSSGEQVAYLVYDDKGNIEKFCIEHVTDKTHNRTVEFDDSKPELLLFKNILVSLWNAKIDGDQGYYLSNYLQKIKNKSVLSEEKVEITWKYIRDTLSEAEKELIFTPEIKQWMITTMDDEDSLFPCFADIYEVEDGDFYKALNISTFDPYVIIEKIC